MILKFRVEGQTLFPLPTNDIPREGSRDYLKVDFDFGCGTEAYTKTVYFTAEEEGEEAPFSTAVVYEGEPIRVDDYFAQKSFAISVGFVLGDRSYTTNEVSVPLDPASDVWLNLPPNLDIPAYQQLVQLAQESRDLAHEATEEASGATQLAKDAADAAAAVTETAATALNKATTAETTANTAAENAEEARLLAEDAEQTAITAISMGNHVIRASTADGVSYVAPKSDTLPAIATGTAGGHKGKGTRIVLIPSGPNTVASPTLKVGDGEAIPIRLRSAANKGENAQVPDATDDIPVGALMVGVPYAMTFCGKYWLIDSLIGGVGGGKVFVQPNEPVDAPDGSLWVDTDEDEPDNAPNIVTDPAAAQNGDYWLDPSDDYVLRSEMESYVDSAIQTALAAIPIAEEGAY